MQELKCPLQMASLSDDQGPEKPPSTHPTEMMSRVLVPLLHDGDAGVTLRSAATRGRPATQALLTESRTKRNK